MFIQFSVKNFRSFRDRVTLSLVAAPDKSQPVLPQNVVPQARGTKLDLLRCVAIYGANASGKSNLVDAIQAMQGIVLDDPGQARRNRKHRVTAFKLDQRYIEQPTEFEIVFLNENVQYTYGFALDADGVVAEWLYSSGESGRQRVLFERPHPDGRNAGEIYFGTYWQGEKKKIADLVREDALYISTASQFKIPLARTVHNWFKNGLRWVSWFPEEGSEFQYTLALAARSPDFKDTLTEFIGRADLGISDIRIKQVPFLEGQQAKRMPPQLLDLIAKDVPDGAVDYEVSCYHHGIDVMREKMGIALDLDEESAGTKKLFALAGPWQYVLENGCTLIIDEMDARVHPHLTKWLVSLFHNDRTNPRGAQLIFTTHDDNLLENDVLRRDQVWFTEKDSEGASSLFSLWDYKRTPRRRENLRKGYLAGRYGAVPFIEGSYER